MLAYPLTTALLKNIFSFVHCGQRIKTNLLNLFTSQLTFLLKRLVLFRSFYSVLLAHALLSTVKSLMELSIRGKDKNNSELFIFQFFNVNWTISFGFHPKSQYYLDPLGLYQYRLKVNQKFQIQVSLNLGKFWVCSNQLLLLTLGVWR